MSFLARPVSRQRRRQQATGARLRLYRPCVPVSKKRAAGFVTDEVIPGFTVRYAHPPGCPRHLTHGL